MVGLCVLVQRTKMGKAMRAVAEDKESAALMGIDVDRVIANTFAISGVLAGAAGVMWGLHMGIIYHFVGFIPGLKAFTAAVMGGIGNIPGAMLGGLSLGLLEALGPAVLGIPFQLKDVLAFRSWCWCSSSGRRACWAKCSPRRRRRRRAMKIRSSLRDWPGCRHREHFSDPARPDAA